jgi:hypothetical protein
MNAHDIVATVSSGRMSAVEIVRGALDRIAAAKALNHRHGRSNRPD